MNERLPSSPGTVQQTGPARAAGMTAGLAGGLLIVVLAGLGSGTGSLSGWVLALGLYAAIAVPVVRGLPGHHPFRRFGPANRVTLARAALVCALAGAVVAGDAPGWPGWLLAALAAALDGVDGWLARRSRLASRFGARFDLEIDALLILVLSLLAWRCGRAGAWVLASGAMRYVFVAAAAAWPWLAAPLPPSTRRKAICAAQVITLLLCLLPGMPATPAALIAGAGLLALMASFAIDVRWLRHHGDAGIRAGAGVRVGVGAAAGAGAGAGHRPWAAAALTALILNGLLAFENWWPTPAIRPLAQLAPEFLGLWLLLLLVAGRSRRRPGRTPAWLLGGLALAYLLLVIGRYVDVTSPALYGRRFSWYWDAPHLPGLLAGAMARTSMAVGVGVALVTVAGLLGAAWGLRVLIARLATAAVSARRSPGALGLTAVASLLLAGHLAADLIDARPAWRLVSPAVLPGWWQQARLAWLAGRPDAMDSVLPASPVFASDLARVRGVDVVLIFSESYGAASIDDPALAEALAPARRRLAEAIVAAGMTVVSAQVRSPTFGGGSWLAHAALLAGVDTGDPHRYPLLLASGRDNLVRHFARQGHRTIALMPGLQAAWPEGRFYGFDTLLDAATLDYRGPAFGLWRIPDQYALARLDQLEARAAADGEAGPRFVVFATISSHLPFDPVPPIQTDWSKLAGAEPFDPGEVAAALARQPAWLALREPWLRSLAYGFDWLGQWLQRPAPRERLVIVVGDHQPAASVSGRDASWNVPVHVITADAVIAERLRAVGFDGSLAPAGPAAGDLPWLLHQLLAALAAEAVSAVSAEATAPATASPP